MHEPAPDFSELKADILRLAAAEHPDPFSVLGLHQLPKDQGQSVRVFHPGARAVRVVLEEQHVIPLRALASGFFAGLVARGPKRPAYCLQIETPNRVFTGQDPYRFGLVISADDAISLKAGRCWHAHRVLGAHQVEVEGVLGISFSVWAPTAKRVSVVGDWNGWDARLRPMRFRHEIGVWEVFEPDLPPGSSYAFDLLTADGHCLRKRDPYARALCSGNQGGAPQSAAHAAQSLSAPWTDQEWLARRPVRETERGFAAIHRIPPTAPGPQGKAHEVMLDDIQKQGGTHLCLMNAWTPQPNAPLEAAPISRLAPGRDWGGASGLQALIDSAHGRGLGVLIDWPIDAFSPEPEGLGRFDGSALYESADPARAVCADGSFRRFNYARYEAANFLLSAALFWLEDMHIDGLMLRGVNEALCHRAGMGERAIVDAAGVDFLRRLTELVAARAPGAAVLSDADCMWPGITAPTWAGGLGCTGTASANWIGWQADAAAQTLARLGLSETSGVLAFDAWLAAHGQSALAMEARLAALLMGMLPGWKLWPDFARDRANESTDLGVLVAALNQAKPHGELGLLAYPDARRELLAFTRGQSWLCAANFSSEATQSTCPAPAAGEYQIIARSQHAKTKAPARIAARFAPDTATGWVLPLSLPPRSAMAAQRTDRLQ